jgi:hypothetical protein
VAFATSRHFVELDQDYLQDKIGLVQKIVRESPSSDLLSTKLDELWAVTTAYSSICAKEADWCMGQMSWCFPIFAVGRSPGNARPLTGLTVTEHCAV